MMPQLQAPGPHRVSAWVWRVVNPLIERFRQEVFLLEKGNVTWRFYSQRCEFIRPVEEYIHFSQLPNYEDFISDPVNSEFSDVFQSHDEAVHDVESGASRFFDGLIQSELFKGQVERSLTEYVTAATSDTALPDLASMKDLPKYVVEYLINRTGLLPSHYTAHKFWSKYKSAFEQNDLEFEPYKQRDTFHKLQSAVDSLKSISADALSKLELHRQSLCRTFDVPPAPIEAVNSKRDEFSFGAS